MSKQDYTIIYEQSPTGSWGAYVKGLPGSCVATGQTREECERRIREAIPLPGFVPIPDVYAPSI